VSRLLGAVLGLLLVGSLSACSSGDNYYRVGDNDPKPGPTGSQKYTDLPIAHALYGGCKEARRYPHTEGYRWCKRHNLLPAPKHNRFDTLGKWED
jgi:hypothetical protein